MIVGGSYKQQCPSCEAMVLIKSPALVGKKIECPKCKDRFIVAKPPAAKKPAEIDEEENGQAEEQDETPPARTDKVRSGKPPLKKPAVRGEASDEEESAGDSDAELKPAKKTTLRVQDEEPGDNGEDAQPTRPDVRVKPGMPAKSKTIDKLKKASKPAPVPQEQAEQPESSEGEGDAAPKPKKKFKGFNFNIKLGKLGDKKMALGLGLAVVGVVVLMAALYFIMAGSQPITPKRPPFLPPPGPGPGAMIKDKDGKDKDKKDKGGIVGKDKDKGKDPPKDKLNKDLPPEFAIQPLQPPGPELTCLFPPDTEQIVHINFKALLDTNSPFFDAAFNAFTVPGPFSEGLFKQRLGFDVTKINDIYQAERFSGKQPWSFTVIHVNDNLDMRAIVAAFVDAFRVNPPIKAQDYYQVIGANWAEQLGKLGIGVPPSLRYILPNREGRPLYLRRHNHQTLVIGDKEPMEAFLKVEGLFPYYGDKNDPKKAEPKKDDAGATYRTINPELKKLIEKSFPGDNGLLDVTLFASGTDLAAAQATSNLPQNHGLILYRSRPFWDLTCMLQERKPILKSSSVSLVKRGDRQFQFRTELTCNNDAQVKELTKELFDVTVPRIIQVADLLLELKIDPPPADGKPGPNPARTTLTVQGPAVAFVLELGMSREVFAKATELFSMLMMDARAELALWEEKSPGELRRQLGRAANQAAVAGLDKRFAPKTFPPATFARPGKDPASRNPGLRISWMASLLPYLGHEKLYERIYFDSSWQDPLNVPAGRTLVAQFLDPRYPEWSRTVAYPDLLAEYAATHYVGVAGVGLDAAELPLGHPKRGIFGYDQSASLADVQKGRGLSNTMLMIQVPPDALGGVTPWIAGGGSTLRGIPESRSIEPFVLTRDRNQKLIQQDKRSGTYVVMADGSVRFVTSKVSDSVLQSMATYLERPKNDLDSNGETPKLSDPEVEKKEKEKEKKEPPKK